MFDANNHYSVVEYLTDISKQNVTAQVERLKSFVWEQQKEENAHDRESAFYWMIKEEPFSYMGKVSSWLLEHSDPNDESVPAWKKMPDGSKKKCDYFRQEPSTVLRLFYKQLYTAVDARLGASDTVGKFHIRRNDAIKQCDTSLTRIQRYLECSLKGHRSKLGNLTIILASDERDPCYRIAIQQLVEDVNGFNMLDLDALAWDIVGKHVNEKPEDAKFLNNMVIFSFAQKFLGKYHRINFGLEQRRHMACPNCTNISKQLSRTVPRDGWPDVGGSKEPRTSLAAVLLAYDECRNASSA